MVDTVEGRNFWWRRVPKPDLLTCFLRDRAEAVSSIYHATFEPVHRLSRLTIYEIPVLNL